MVLWAARDDDGTLCVFNVEPEITDGEWSNKPHSDWCGVQPELLPDLAPGEKCEVEIVRKRDVAS